MARYRLMARGRHRSSFVLRLSCKHIELRQVACFTKLDWCKFPRDSYRSENSLSHSGTTHLNVRQSPRDWSSSDLSKRGRNTMRVQTSHATLDCPFPSCFSSPELMYARKQAEYRSTGSAKRCLVVSGSGVRESFIVFSFARAKRSREELEVWWKDKSREELGWCDAKVSEFDCGLVGSANCLYRCYYI